MSQIKTANCIEQHRDPDATHITLELDPPATFHGVETQHFRIIETNGTRQFIADNGAWQHISDMGAQLPLDKYLLRYYGYHEPLVSKLRRVRGRWDDLRQPPKGIPYELALLWGSLDAVQRLLVAITADRVIEALAACADDDDEIDYDWS